MKTKYKRTESQPKYGKVMKRSFSICWSFS